MDDETLETAAERPRLPSAGMPGPSARTIDETAGRDASERNGIFRSLVSDDSDIAGLVAYSIYKQNKLDWLAAFEAAKGRVPTEAELASYIIGEGTPRRIATYRHLAEATLSGNGPEGTGHRTRASLRDSGGLTPPAIAAYAVILLVLLVGFWIALHFMVATH
ncbi:hypothetical protein RHAL1_02185 [Beijerinckiaceae bacterium RH AL1]|nr:hypothetical protein [Beijerinckiaceae bacterium]VVB46231.1 hypothetical protein RHCH11_RHCH11_02141 [Beijerinckiaceae bacterium RH CH11]VVB46316.1 hypothetical protein RHAL8_02137 [Beijerinckiaceae bacterium RH AL8]VVC55270.1 hypothetical protein RHAL1_02185 [Beijerinckiaceae bacterium RH AL1]